MEMQKTVLLVEDDKSFRESVRKLLEKEGMRVLEASSGEEGIEMLKTDRVIDLVLLDLVMPRLGGRETFHALKAINPSVKVVLSTGYGHNEAVQALLNAGVSGFVPKPYHLRTLSEMLVRVLGER